MLNELNATPEGWPDTAEEAFEALDILRRAYVPKNTSDAKFCLAALNLLRRDVAGQEASDNLTRAVFLDLLGQVDQFIEEQGEADFYTGPARALRCALQDKTPEPHLQAALAKFILDNDAGIPDTKGGSDAT